MRKISSETNKIIDYSLNETNERANTGSKDLDVRMTSAIQRSANQSDIKIVLNYCEKNLNLIFFTRLMKKKIILTFSMDRSSQQPILINSIRDGNARFIT